MPGIGGVAGDDEQAVEAQHAAVLQLHAALNRVHRLGAAALHADAQLGKVIGRVPQVRAALAHLAHQQVGDGHARVRRLGLVTEDEDLVLRCVLADGLGGDDAGRAGTKNDMLHERTPQEEKRRSENRLGDALW